MVGCDAHVHIGRNLVGDHEVEPKASGTLRAGERLRIETPGGGGHGAPRA